MREQLAKIFGKNTQARDNEVIKVHLDEIKVANFQPRKHFEQDALKKLAESIKEVGIIQPIIVRKTGDGLELIAGERRLRAAKIAGLTEITAIVRELGEREAAEMALIENLQREDLDYFEEAEGYLRLIAEFGLKQEELARRIGRSQAAVANKLRLLKLPPAVREKIACDRITERHARVLLKLPDEKMQSKVLKEIYQEGLTVQGTEMLVERIVKNISREIISQQRKKRIPIIKDLRIFINAIQTAIDTLKASGVKASAIKDDGEDKVVITVTIEKPKK